MSLLYFVLNRLSMAFVFVFILMNTKERKSTVKYICISLASWLFSGIFDYMFYQHETVFVQCIAIIMDFLVVILVSYYSSGYRDFRSVFIAVNAWNFTLGGTAWGLITYIISHSIISAVAVLVVINLIAILLEYFLVSKKFFQNLLSSNLSWGLLSLIPFFFYLTFCFIAYWPNYVHKNLKTIPAMISLLTLMLCCFFVLVHVFNTGTRKQERDLAKERFGVLEEEKKFGLHKYKALSVHATSTIDKKVGAFRIIIISVLDILVLGFAVVVINNFRLNKTYNDLSFEEMHRMGGLAGIEILPRGGKSGAWDKDIHKNTPDHFVAKGVTYDLSLENLSPGIIEEWEMRLDIQQDLWLNNAWCGTVEVHQSTPNGTIVQELDLRNFEWNSVKLDYIQGEADLFIPLHKGDYIIYKPNSQINEYPIGGVNKQTGLNEKVTVGFIFYHPYGDEILPMDNGTISLNLRRVLTKQPEFWVFIALFILWSIGCMFTLGYAISRRRAMEDSVRDRERLDEMIHLATNSVDARDPYTAGHSERVGYYSWLIAIEMGLPEQDADIVKRCGLLHDYGKIAISESILQKPGRLSAAEFDEIKKHTIKGAEIFKTLTTLPQASIVAHYHHERYDGKGYPEGLKGNEIPTIARIVSVADAFDAMNSSRVYRPQLSRESIIVELEKNSGSQFDPEIVKAFLNLLRQGILEEYSSIEKK